MSFSQAHFERNIPAGPSLDPGAGHKERKDEPWQCGAAIPQGVSNPEHWDLELGMAVAMWSALHLPAPFPFHVAQISWGFTRVQGHFQALYYLG